MREVVAEVGTLYYGAGHGGSPPGFVVDDALLVHLRQVIVVKLQRHESFVVTVPAFEHGHEVREALWMHPAVPLRFDVDEVDGLALDHDRLAAMMVQANTVGGIVLEARSAQAPTYAARCSPVSVERAPTRSAGVPSKTTLPPS
jgi:hypothetical protein